MFTVYYSNQIENHKDLLAELLRNDPNPNPFEQETVLVQSMGMAQWLQMSLAEKLGIMGNIEFPYPTSFLWQQYRLLFPELPKENIFARNTMIWRLIRLLPNFLANEHFQPLENYLKEQDQLKQYQLACKIADLFDQYLVYRPHWLLHWENGELEEVLAEIKQNISLKSSNHNEIQQSMLWQSILWNALVEDIKNDTSEIVFNTSHRAYLQQRYFEKLDNLNADEQARLPKRIFIFGISSLPKTQLLVLKKLSEFCHIHLFFTNPSEQYWGNDVEDRVLEKLALQKAPSSEELDEVLVNQGNPLLSTWGKQGKEFLNLIIEQEPTQEIPFYLPEEAQYILQQVKQAILKNEHASSFELSDLDHSIQLHSCHSKMREVEVLHNQLLSLFEQDSSLSPKDIIVMSPDIDSYAPYINAVFSAYDRNDPRFIPFTLSDQKITYIDPIISSFLNLLSIKERKFTAEEILDLFDVKAIREKYCLSEQQLSQLREWIRSVGIRAGLRKQNPEWNNYNSWENGLNRLLLGICLRGENNVWQDTLAFDQSYGLSAEITGYLASFIENLSAWVAFLQQPQSLFAWKIQLIELIANFYQEDNENSEVILNLTHAVTQIIEQIEQTNFVENIEIDVIEQLFIQQLSEQRSNLQFLVGKVNFCTLLPMRAIPFKVVCLLGMNEGDFPRLQTLNSFDLMQYAPQKGDRAKRDDDRYLFLEALLSAQEILYISYIGQSLVDSSEKLPSILVAQLTDYINQRVKYGKKLSVTEHPMTVFSANNFKNGIISYDKEWLAATLQIDLSSNFIKEIDKTLIELPTEIELTDLINYLQSPVKFYFNRQLGIRFEHYDESIDESEHFQLSGLDKYYLLDDLLNVDLGQDCQFFENAKLQGNLPACYFSEISQTELLSSISALREKLKPYLDNQSEIIEIDQKFLIDGNEIRLVGNIPNKFKKEVVQWRVGGLKDKYIIQSWIYYLALNAANNDTEKFRYYYRDKESVGCLAFNDLPETDAKQLLIQYISDYVSSFYSLKWAITEKLSEYVKKANDDKTSVLEQCQTALQSSEDEYIQRVLMQSDELDFADLHQRTLTWFEPMIEHINKES